MDARSPAVIDLLRDEHRSLDEILQGRIDGLSQWLDKNAPECQGEQRHLDEGAAERAYWHFGYLMALRDVQNAIRKQRRTSN